MKYRIPPQVVPEDWDDYCVSYYIPQDGRMVPCVSPIEREFFTDIPDNADMNTLVLKPME